MFLRFVERKGWLRFGGDEAPQPYLHRLFAAGPIGQDSWYNSRLKALFFQGLAIPDRNLHDIVGDIPYLNGGLFEATPLDEQVTDVPDVAFGPLLSDAGLFYRYNFTVEESTPLDVEVAVDPEMLGKVFEKLTNERRQKGSYYTPRTVVSFMCRETLKGYLGAHYAPLIDEDNAEAINVRVARELLGKLASVKVVDPACGSGAYLLGMLQELFHLTSLLDTRAETVTPQDAYNRKLTIIQNNLYGVDIDDFAINIARLRLWLSLAVQFEGDQPEPLPNLDFKIEAGNSLTAPNPSVQIQPGLHRELMRRYVELRKSYLNPPPGTDKPLLLRRINELKEDIVGWLHAAGPVEGFDWQVEFLEVFLDGGFDIVLANPPYGVAVDDRTRNQYFNQRSNDERGQSKDSYGIFIARGLQLLREHGTLSYIVSDTWRTIKSHRPLRRRLLDASTVFHVLDLPKWIFDATVYTGIVTLKKTPPEPEHKLVAGDLRAIPDGDWKMLSDNLTAIAGHGPDIQTLACARYTYPQSLIRTYSNLSFFIASPDMYAIMSNPDVVRFGDIGAAVHGISTGRNAAYVRRAPGTRGNLPVIEDWMKMPAEEIAALSDDENVSGVDKDWQALAGCFVPFEKGGSSDAQEGWLPNYYMPTEYYINWAKGAIEDMRTNPGVAWKNEQYFFKSGLTFSISGIYAPTFRLNSGGVFEAKGSGIFCDALPREILLGLFCSLYARYQLKNYIKHTVDTSGDNINEFRFPPLDEATSARISGLVESIINNQRTELRYAYWLNEQKELDAIIYALYALAPDAIREIELWYCRRYRMLAEAQGVLAEAQEKYTDHLARCEMILSKPPSYWRSNPVLELIARGEGHTLEFKETLQYNIHTNRADPAILHSALKTIAAFLNTDGGTLLVGVSDTGEIKGLDRDMQVLGRNANNDRFERKIRDALSGQNARFAPHATGLVDVSFAELTEGTVCRVDVRPLPPPDVLHFDNAVYIRDGNRTVNLEGPALTRWIQQRNHS
jgi:hypothetical protein